jgi:hypothetical protein
MHDSASEITLYWPLGLQFMTCVPEDVTNRRCFVYLPSVGSCVFIPVTLCMYFFYNFLLSSALRKPNIVSFNNLFKEIICLSHNSKLHAIWNEPFSNISGSAADNLNFSTLGHH